MYTRKYNKKLILNNPNHYKPKPHRIMQTRSQTKTLSFTIDFDEASAAWKANKKNIGNGSYKYICCAVKNRKQCTKKCLAGENYCKTHYNTVHALKF